MKKKEAKQPIKATQEEKVIIKTGYLKDGFISKMAEITYSPSIQWVSFKFQRLDDEYVFDAPKLLGAIKFLMNAQVSQKTTVYRTEGDE